MSSCIQYYCYVLPPPRIQQLATRWLAGTMEDLAKRVLAVAV